MYLWSIFRPANTFCRSEIILLFSMNAIFIKVLYLLLTKTWTRNTKDKVSFFVVVVVVVIQKERRSHCFYWILNGKRPGIESDGNFSSYLIRRSEYGWLFPFPVGGNGNNPIYPLLSAFLSTSTEPETYFG
mgnify:CR=1 FL=1